MELNPSGNTQQVVKQHCEESGNKTNMSMKQEFQDKDHMLIP